MKIFIKILTILVLLIFFGSCSEKKPEKKIINVQNWEEVKKKAKEQTVYFSAWGGGIAINQYIDWASKQVEKSYGVKVKHIKEKDPGDAITRILAEKAAGKETQGSIDIIWLNGENFKSLKKNNMLFQFVQFLPNQKFLAWKEKNLDKDFTEPTDNLEAPWGTAKLTFIYDSKRVAHPPQNSKQLLDYLKNNPGKFSYPKPPNFYGSTFLKQILLELNPNKSSFFNREVTDEEFLLISQPLWQYLDELHPLLWKKGKIFPNDISQVRQSLADQEIELMTTFNPYEALNYVKREELPETTRSYFFENGTIGNTHYLAIPKNSSAKAGALVFINFLLSPKAQARKSDPEFWGDPTVLDLTKLSEMDKETFDKIQYGDVAPKKWTKNLPEPHPFWMERLEQEWQKRYAAN